MSDRVGLFIAGFPKCGSSALWEILAGHPEVSMAAIKQTHFFDLNYAKGVDHYHRHWRGESQTARLRGEATPTYALSAIAMQRVHEYNPAARIVLCVREPADRAFSDWWMFRSRGVEELTFAEAIAANRDALAAGQTFDTAAGLTRYRDAFSSNVNDRVLLRTYIDFGMYGARLAQILTLFPREQVWVCVLEEFSADPATVLSDLERFLGLSQPLTNDPTSQRHRNPSLGAAAPIVWRVARRIGLLSFAGRLPVGTRNAIKRALTRARPAPRLSDADRSELRGSYAADRARFEGLLGRRIPAWDD